MDRSINTGINKTVKALIVVSNTVALTIAGGYVLATLWAWFVAPVTGITLFTTNAIGISLIVRLLTADIKLEDLEKRTSFSERMMLSAMCALYLLITLAIGYLTLQFM